MTGRVQHPQGDDLPMRLSEVVELCFRPGDMTVSGLRRERDRGHLHTFFMAGREPPNAVSDRETDREIA